MAVSFRHNRILAALSAADHELLQPHMQHIELKQKTVLYDALETIERTYFPTSGVVSLVITLGSGETIEIAMVGRDGIVGGEVLSNKHAINRAVIQVAGASFVIAAEPLRKIISKSDVLRKFSMRYEEFILAQAQQSAACNAVHQIENRLARWLLRTHDLVGSKHLELTQEFLADMLAVRRSSVSIAAHTFQKAGLISYRRGHIEILDLQGLQDTSCECHGSLNGHYKRLMRSG